MLIVANIKILNLPPEIISNNKFKNIRARTRHNNLFMIQLFSQFHFQYSHFEFINNSKWLWYNLFAAK